MRVLVDLTPIVNGGENGGAKGLALALVRALQSDADEFVVVCRQAGFNDIQLALPDLDTIIVDDKEISNPNFFLDLDADVAFLPFTDAPDYIPPSIPLCVVVHDLLALDRPDFFSPEDVAARRAAAASAVNRASVLVAISNFTKQSIISHFDCDPERIVVIHNPTIKSPSPFVDPLLSTRLKLNGQYVFYPANFWPHKNHISLLLAWGEVHRRNPALQLVLTGAVPESEYGDTIKGMLRDSAHRGVRYLGYTTDEEVNAIYAKSIGVVFPSLYEGYGMPLAEAIIAGKPIVCGREASIPEVAGQFANYVDVRNPSELADAINKIANADNYEPAGNENNGAKSNLPSLELASELYRQALVKACNQTSDRTPSVRGLYPDMWMSKNIRILLPSEIENSKIRVELFKPQHPAIGQRLIIRLDGEISEDIPLDSGHTIIRSEIKHAKRSIEIDAAETWSPAEVSGSIDIRDLSLLIQKIEIYVNNKWYSLLQADQYSQNIRLIIADRAQQKLVGIGSDLLELEKSVSQPKSFIGRIGYAEVKMDHARLDRVLKKGGDQILDCRDWQFGSRPAKMPKSSTPLHGMSIIMPSYNQGDFIGEAISSVLENSCVTELIIFDGGSTDQTAQVVEGFSDERIKFTSEPDSGQSDAINKGFLAARCDLIGWLNSDDIYLSKSLDCVIDDIDECKPIIYYGEGYHIDIMGQILERYPTESFDLAALYDRCFICQPTTIFTRKALQKSGLLRPDIRYGMDYELWIRAASKGVRFEKLPTEIACTRVHDDTKTFGDTINVHLEQVSVFAKIFGVTVPKWTLALASVVLKERFPNLHGSERADMFDQLVVWARSYAEASLDSHDQRC